MIALAALLSIGERTVCRFRSTPPNPALVRAIRLQLGLMSVQGEQAEAPTGPFVA